VDCAAMFADCSGNSPYRKEDVGTVQPLFSKEGQGEIFLNPSLSPFRKGRLSLVTLESKHITYFGNIN